MMIFAGHFDHSGCLQLFNSWSWFIYVVLLSLSISDHQKFCWIGHKPRWFPLKIDGLHCWAAGDTWLARLVTWLVPSTVGFAPDADWVEAVLWLSPAGARTGEQGTVGSPPSSESTIAMAGTADSSRSHVGFKGVNCG